MTVEEKLKHFYEASLNEAHRQSDEAIEEYKAVLLKDYEDFVANTESLANARLKSEENRIKNDLNHEFSMKILSAKKDLNDKHYELKNALSEEVKQLLDEFKSQRDYKDRIVAHVKDAIEFAGNDPVTIFLDDSDSGLLDMLSRQFDCEFKISEESFGGGIKAIVDDRILIDHSFDSRFRQIFENFAINGGSSNE